MDYYIHRRGAGGGLWRWAAPGAGVPYGPQDCVTVGGGLRTCVCGEMLIGPRPVDPAAAYWWPWSEEWASRESDERPGESSSSTH